MLIKVAPTFPQSDSPGVSLQRLSTATDGPVPPLVVPGDLRVSCARYARCAQRHCYGDFMPYPSHYLLQFGGPRNTLNDELWTCGIRMVPVGGDLDPADTKTYLDTVCVPALAAWIARAGSLVGNTAKLGFAKLNRIAPDGTYAEPLTISYFWATPVAGASSSTNVAAMIPQCSLVITWETDTVSRGLASRGRIYSPAPSVAPDAMTGLFAAGLALGVVTSAGLLIKALKGAGGAGSMVPNIVSDGGAGVAHRIDKVSVDNKVDIVRKRANGIVAARSRAAVPA